MKIKIFTALSIHALEKKVNDFLKNKTIEVIDVQFAYGYAVMVTYKEI